MAPSPIAPTPFPGNGEGVLSPSAGHVGQGEEWSVTMNNLDPDVRARIIRIVIALVGVVVISFAIGLSVGRPFASPQTAAEPTASAETAAAPTSPPATPMPTSPPTPTRTLATLAPEDGWLIRSTDTFERPSNWPAQQQPGWASGYQDGRYFLKLDGQQTISYRVPLDSNEFRISADVQVGDGYAGLVFLSGDSNDLYRFQIDSAGRYRLARRQGGNVVALIDWTSAAALKSGVEAVNQIEVRRVENEISLYANQTRLAAYTLPAGAKLEAQVGFTLDALARDKVALASFDNLVVRVPVVPQGN
jgi:hypothetical protein